MASREVVPARGRRLLLDQVLPVVPLVPPGVRPQPHLAQQFVVADFIVMEHNQVQVETVQVLLVEVEHQSLVPDGVAGVVLR